MLGTKQELACVLSPLFSSDQFEIKLSVTVEELEIIHTCCLCPRENSPILKIKRKVRKGSPNFPSIRNAGHSVILQWGRAGQDRVPKGGFGQHVGHTASVRFKVKRNIGNKKECTS